MQCRYLELKYALVSKLNKPHDFLRHTYQRNLADLLIKHFRGETEGDMAEDLIAIYSFLHCSCKHAYEN